MVCTDTSVAVVANGDHVVKLSVITSASLTRVVSNVFPEPADVALVVLVVVTRRARYSVLEGLGLLVIAVCR